MRRRKSKIKEGTVNHDGCKPPPLTPKPDIKPKPMPRHVERIEIVILKEK